MSVLKVAVNTPQQLNASALCAQPLSVLSKQLCHLQGSPAEGSLRQVVQSLTTRDWGHFPGEARREASTS